MDADILPTESFRKLLNSLENDRELLLYVKDSGLFDKKINASNLRDMAANGAFEAGYERFGLSKDDARSIAEYFKKADESSSIAELRSAFPKMED